MILRERGQLAVTEMRHVKQFHDDASKLGERREENGLSHAYINSVAMITWLPNIVNGGLANCSLACRM